MRISRSIMMIYGCILLVNLGTIILILSGVITVAWFPMILLLSAFFIWQAQGASGQMAYDLRMVVANFDPLMAKRIEVNGRMSEAPRGVLTVQPPLSVPQAIATMPEVFKVSRCLVVCYLDAQGNVAFCRAMDPCLRMSRLMPAERIREAKLLGMQGMTIVRTIGEVKGTFWDDITITYLMYRCCQVNGLKFGGVVSSNRKQPRETFLLLFARNKVDMNKVFVPKFKDKKPAKHK